MVGISMFASRPWTTCVYVCVCVCEVPGCVGKEGIQAGPRRTWMMAVPAVAGTSPVSMEIVVVLPAPL